MIRININIIIKAYILEIIKSRPSLAFLIYVNKDQYFF